MSDYIVCKPAYGRNPKSKKQIKEIYDNYQDFEILDVFHGSGKKINRQEVEDLGVELEVRYGKNLEKLTFLP